LRDVIGLVVATNQGDELGVTGFVELIQSISVSKGYSSLREKRV
jgi:hypothetical protein